MLDIEDSDFVAAVLIWTGWGRNVSPQRNDAALVNRFGHDAAAALLDEITTLEDDFYSSNARFVASDLAEMERIAIADFRRQHPNVADDVVNAFAWCYVFDFK